jgi:hypothetical protein
VLLAGGIEYRLKPTMTLSVDLTHTEYQDDKIGDETRFAFGSQTTLRLRGRAYFGFDELRLIVYYVRQAESRILGDDERTARQTVPNQGHLLASYRKRLGGVLYLTILGQGRLFGETEGFRSLLGDDLSTGRRSMVDLGVAPEIRLTDSVRMVGRFLYTLGDITGVEGGFGLTLTL